MEGLILACDFGGTKLSAGVVDTAVFSQSLPVWHKHLRRLSPAGATAASDIRMMMEMGRELLAGKRPFAVGISFGGPVDYKTGVVRLSHHVPGWENVPLKQRFSQEFNAPVWVDNDANLPKPPRCQRCSLNCFRPLWEMMRRCGVLLPLPNLKM